MNTAEQPGNGRRRAARYGGERRASAMNLQRVFMGGLLLGLLLVQGEGRALAQGQTTSSAHGRAVPQAGWLPGGATGTEQLIAISAVWQPAGFGGGVAITNTNTIV